MTGGRTCEKLIGVALPLEAISCEPAWKRITEEPDEQS